MGSVIRLDNQEGSTREILTETGSGGLLSAGYLRDRPARSYLQDTETPVVAVANDDAGVLVERNGDHQRFEPGSGYRAIVVLTDRRVVATVGDTTAPDVDGDFDLAVPLLELETVELQSGDLVLTREGGNVLRFGAGGSNLSTALEYLRHASQAWIHVENELDAIKRSLVDATSERDTGDCETALDIARDAYERLDDPRSTAHEFADEWGGEALLERVDGVEARCLETLAEVRLGRARQFSDRGEARWREEDYEAAHDAYDRALEAYEAILADGARYLEDPESVREEADRVERVTDKLQRAPLQKAIEADRAAGEMDEPEAAADAWEDAIAHYRTAMELDWGADERRFAGDPNEIRDRLETVVDQVVSARRSAASGAKQAGEWHFGAEQYDIAIEEFETAREQYRRALEVAEDLYPDATDHLQVELDELEERLERARAGRDGEAVDATDAEPTEDEPAYDVDATIGAGAGETPVEPGPTPVETSGPDRPETVTGRLREMDQETFAATVAEVLAETGWDTARLEEGPFDVRAQKDEPADETMLVKAVHRPDGDDIDAEAVDDCADDRREVPEADAVMVATSAGVSSEATRHARRRQVRLLDDECLSAVIESRELETVGPTPLEASD